jgi:hypothetical protein
VNVGPAGDRLRTEGVAQVVDAPYHP